MSISDSDVGARQDPGGAHEFKPSAALRIFGEQLDFDLISRGLAIQPSDTHRKGETGLGGRRFTHDLWSVKAPVDRKERLDKHLLLLSQMLEPHYPFLSSLKGQAQLRSFCGIIADGHDCAFRLSPEALRIFTLLHIDMELSLIFLCLDTEAPPLETVPEAPSPGELNAERQQFRKESKLSMRITAPTSELKRACEVIGLPSSRLQLQSQAPLSGVTRGFDVWTLTCPLPLTDELDSHLRWLGGILLGHSEYLRSLKPQADMLVLCDFLTESDTGGVDISPEALKLCTEIDIPLEVNAALI